MFTTGVILFKMWKIVKVELSTETCTLETMLNLNLLVLLPFFQLQFIQLTFLRQYNKLEVKSGKVFFIFSNQCFVLPYLSNIRRSWFNWQLNSRGRKQGLCSLFNTNHSCDSFLIQYSFFLQLDWILAPSLMILPLCLSQMSARAHGHHWVKSS